MEKPRNLHEFPEGQMPLDLDGRWGFETPTLLFIPRFDRLSRREGKSTYGLLGETHQRAGSARIRHSLKL